MQEYTYHNTDALEGGEECTLTEQVSDIVLPFFTYTSCDPQMVAAAASGGDIEIKTLSYLKYIKNDLDLLSFIQNGYFQNKL